jgi:hypothetical protein
LIGASRYHEIFPTRDIIVPFQTLVDFKGFRIVAVPVLPIDKSTLVSGSSNAGLTVLHGNSKINSILFHAAKELHLCPHIVGESILYCAGDVEVHLGKDEIYYILDMSRCFPPESPQSQFYNKFPGVSNSVFFRMLRPELLKISKTDSSIPPLSPDAFSRWGSVNKSFHDGTVSAATQLMFRRQLPRCAQFLSNRSPAAIQRLNFSQTLHEYGVNIRHTAAVANLCSRIDIRKKSCEEILTRTLKNLLRKIMRDNPNEQEKKRSICICIQEFSQLSRKTESDIELRFGEGSVDLLRKCKPSCSELGRIIVKSCLSAGIILLEETRISLEKSCFLNDLCIDPSEIRQYSTQLKKLSSISLHSIGFILCSADAHLRERRRDLSLRLRRLAKLELSKVLANDPNNCKARSLMFQQNLLLLGKRSQTHSKENMLSTFRYLNQCFQMASKGELDFDANTNHWRFFWAVYDFSVECFHEFESELAKLLNYFSVPASIHLVQLASLKTRFRKGKFSVCLEGASETLSNVRLDQDNLEMFLAVNSFLTAFDKVLPPEWINEFLSEAHKKENTIWSALLAIKLSTRKSWSSMCQDRKFIDLVEKIRVASDFLQDRYLENPFKICEFFETSNNSKIQFIDLLLQFDFRNLLVEDETDRFVMFNMMALKNMWIEMFEGTADPNSLIEKANGVHWHL